MQIDLFHFKILTAVRHPVYDENGHKLNRKKK